MMNYLEITKHYKAVLPAEDFILTGSVALREMGFGNRIKDLDLILVNPPDSTIEVLKGLQEQFPPHNLTTTVYPGDWVVYRFVHDNIMIDVFVSKEKIYTNLKTHNDIDIAPISYIVEQKLRLGRAKDYIDLLRLSRSIMSNEKFDKYVNDK